MGTLSVSGAFWLTLASITWLLSAEALGQYALALALIGPAYTLSLLHMSTLQATDQRRRYTFGDYLALRIWTTLGAAAYSMIVAASLWPDRDRSLIVLALALGLTAGNASSLCGGTFRRLERLDYAGLSMLLRSGARIGVLVPVLALTGDLVVALLARSVVSWAAVLLLDLPWTRRVLTEERPGVPAAELLRPRWDSATSLRIAMSALPIGLVLLATDLHVTVSRLVVESVTGVHGLGIFVAIGAVAGVGGTVARAATQALVPRFSMLASEGDTAEIRRLLHGIGRVAVLVGTLGVVVAALIGRPLLAALFGPEHAAHHDLLVLFAAGTAATYQLGLHASVLTGLRRFREQALLRSIQLLVLVTVGPPLTLGYGLAGMGAALVGAETLGLVMHRRLLARVLDGLDRGTAGRHRRA